MPKEIHEIKDFLLTARRKDARLVTIKKNKQGKPTKFKVRCSRYLYVLRVQDNEKVDKLRQSLPPVCVLPLAYHTILNFLPPAFTHLTSHLASPSLHISLHTLSLHTNSTSIIAFHNHFTRSC
eukprot:Phypoly_transcript_19197.p1 GENE.Phypoly_transcript_19197~~Phypoly_transcript_19197.p1  ORF type:complete len:123 (+),score=10.83 Phypoly_transcript_19197:164-532(+)